VSALLHAATRVTAGVFLICRASPLIEYAPHIGPILTLLGGITAFLAATTGLVQTILNVLSHIRPAPNWDIEFLQQGSPHIRSLYFTWQRMQFLRHFFFLAQVQLFMQEGMSKIDAK